MLLHENIHHVQEQITVSYIILHKLINMWTMVRRVLFIASIQNLFGITNVTNLDDYSLLLLSLLSHAFGVVTNLKRRDLNKSKIKWTVKNK